MYTPEPKPFCTSQISEDFLQLLKRQRNDCEQTNFSGRRRTHLSCYCATKHIAIDKRTVPGRACRPHVISEIGLEETIDSRLEAPTRSPVDIPPDLRARRSRGSQRTVINLRATHPSQKSLASGYIHFTQKIAATMSDRKPSVLIIGGLGKSVDPRRFRGSRFYR